MNGSESVYTELTTDPRLTGVDHSERCGPSGRAASPCKRRSGAADVIPRSCAHATSSVKRTNAAPVDILAAIFMRAPPKTLRPRPFRDTPAMRAGCEGRKPPFTASRCLRLRRGDDDDP